METWLATWRHLQIITYISSHGKQTQHRKGRACSHSAMCLEWMFIWPGRCSLPLFLLFCCFFVSQMQTTEVPRAVLICHKGNRVSMTDCSKWINLEPVAWFENLYHLEMIVDLYTWSLASSSWPSHVIQPGERLKGNAIILWPPNNTAQGHTPRNRGLLHSSLQTTKWI